MCEDEMCRHVCSRYCLALSSTEPAPCGFKSFSIPLLLLLTRNRCPNNLPPLTTAPLEYNSALCQTLPGPQTSGLALTILLFRRGDLQSRLWDCDSRARSQRKLSLHITPAGGGRVWAGLCPSLCRKWSLKAVWQCFPVWVVVEVSCSLLLRTPQGSV